MKIETLCLPYYCLLSVCALSMIFKQRIIPLAALVN
jgi:hypothetical protein